MARDYFVFYRSFYTALKNLPAEEFMETISAVCEYAFDGTEPDLKGIPFMAFELIRPHIDANNKRYTDGKHGGRPRKTSGFENEKPVVFETETSGYENEKANIKVKDKVKVKEKDKEKDKAKDKKVIAALPQGDSPIEEMGFSPELESTVKSWVRYKTEKRQAYKETGLRSLLTRIRREANERGDRAVINLIQESMSNNWQGIIWDRLGKQTKTTSRVQEVASWNI